MQAAGARSHPACGKRHRIVGALDHRVVVAAVKAHGFHAEHVDGGDHFDLLLEPHVTMLAC